MLAGEVGKDLHRAALGDGHGKFKAAFVEELDSLESNGLGPLGVENKDRGGTGVLDQGWVVGAEAIVVDPDNGGH